MNWLTSFKVKFIPGLDDQDTSEEHEDGKHDFIPETEVESVQFVPEENDGAVQNDSEGGSDSNMSNTDDGKDGDDEHQKLAVVSLRACQQLQELTDSLKKVKLDTSPRFTQVGRDLQDIFGETKTLTDSVRLFADSVHGDEGKNSSLASTERLIQEISQILFKNQQEIEYNLTQIHELLLNLSKFHHVYDAIDRISASFRVVRINIQIQCTVQSISEDLFKGVSGDITSLSKKLDQITKQIKKDLYAAEKNMTGLNKTVLKNLQKIKHGAEQAKGVVAKAFSEIEQLVKGASTMMQNAGENSAVISKKVGDVVVSIQFHDSMSQRFEHTVMAFNDIEHLLSEDELTPGHLGTAFSILDLQHRQLLHLISEVGSIRGSIENSFESMGEEVEQLNSTMQFLQLKGAGQQQHLNNKFSVLQNALMRLCEIFSQSGEMVRQINSSTAETTTVADSLMQLLGEMQGIREETRLQAANTIIMASSLGNKGKTIEVLAREIRSLSDKTNVLADDVTEMQDAMSHLIKELKISTDDDISGICHVGNMEKELAVFRQSYQEIEKKIMTVARQIDSANVHIQSVRDDLSFLADLEGHLILLASQVKAVCDVLAPWQDEASPDSEEVEQLMARYTMEKERMVHVEEGDSAVEDQDEYGALVEDVEFF